jgi:hypothetical protein
VPPLNPGAAALGAAASSAGAPKEREAEGVAVGVDEEESLPVGVGAGDGEAAAVVEGVGVRDAVAVGDLLSEDVTVGLKEAVGVSGTDLVAVSEGETEMVELGLSGDLVALGVTLTLRDVDGVRLVDGETGEAEAVTDRVGVAETLLDGDAGETDAVTLMVGLADLDSLDVEVVDGVCVGVSVGDAETDGAAPLRRKDREGATRRVRSVHCGVFVCATQTRARRATHELCVLVAEGVIEGVCESVEEGVGVSVGLRKRRGAAVRARVRARGPSAI